MNKRVWIAGLSGALAMYVWVFFAHMALPLGEAGVREIDNEEPLLAAMKTTLRDRGLYIFPRMDPSADQAVNERKLAEGPSGLLMYFPSRQFQFGQSLAVEFLTELVLVMVAMYFLSLTRIATFMGRLGFFALYGLAVATVTNVSYWNWYGFPATYTAAYAFTCWVGCVLAGVVAAVMRIGGAVDPVGRAE